MYGQELPSMNVFDTMENMETITISKKEYRALKQAKARLDALSNVTKPKAARRRGSFADFVGILKDVEEFKGKTSVEVQHMIPDLWMEKYRKKRL
jgi:predicted CopG family antitoxin